MKAPLRKETAWLVAGDLSCLAGALLLALTLRNLMLPAPGFFLTHLLAFIPLFISSLVIFFIAGLYEKQTRFIRGVMGGRILSAQAASTVLGAVLFFFLPFTIAPKTVLALYLGLSVVLVSGWRFFAAERFRVSSRERAVLVGAGPTMRELVDEVNQNSRCYFHIGEHIDTETSSSVEDRIQNAIASGVRRIIIDTRDERVRAVLPALYESLQEGVSFVEFSTFYEDVFDRVPLTHVDHAWLLECLPKQHIAYDALKRGFDFILAFIGSLIALPVVLILALLLLPSGAPFIFHARVGKEGKLFRIMKLRTMLFDDHGDPELQKKNRITSLGKFLRKTRLDELPQLINILAGELSFIGPRPELPNLAAVYEKEIPYYGVRHLISPGLSGWAQIWDYDAPRGGVDLPRTKKKLSYDLFYLSRRSFVLDLIITLKTLRALASFSGK